MKERKPKIPIADRFLALAEAVPFRKRGSGYMAIAVILFVIVLSGYLLSAVFRGLETPIQTITAVEYQSSAGCYATGYIVREETVLTSDSSITSLVISEGQKAAAYETVAMGYTSASAQQQQMRIAQLQEELTQLQYAAGMSTAIYDQAAMDAQIRDELMNVAVLLSKGRIAGANAVAPEVKGLVLRRNTEEGDLLAIEAQIREKEAEISRLRQENSGSVKIITAPTAGYFSGTTDGYETVLTPDTIFALSTDQVEHLRPVAQVAGAVGKIISGDKWYFLTVLDADQLKGLKVGSTVSVSFARQLSGSIDMKIAHIGQEEQGKVVLALSVDRYLQDMTLMRQQSADIIFRTHSGLRVPKEAVHVLEDGSVGVYVLESAAVNWKTVEILHDSGASYIVKLDKNSTQNLWPGDEVIVAGVDDLYDGKVIS